MNPSNGEVNLTGYDNGIVLVDNKEESKKYGVVLRKR